MNNIDLIEEGIANKSLYTEALYKRPESLSKYLPYDEYIKDHGIYLLKNGQLGAIFKAELIEHEPMVSSKIVDMVKGLKSWFSLPSNYTLQVLFDQSHISNLDKRWNELSDSYNGHEVSEKLFLEKLSDLKKRKPFERSLYISIKKNDVKKSYNPLNFFMKGEALLFDETKSFIKEMREFNSELKDFMANSKIELERLKGKDLVKFLRKEFNPKTFYKRDFAPFNTEYSISNQVMFSSLNLNFDSIKREGVKSRVISLKMAPNYAYPGGMANFLKLDFAYKISICFSFPEKDKVKRFYDIKEFLLDKASSASGKRQLSEIREAQDKLAHEDRVIYMTFNLIIDGETDEELEEKERKIANIFNNDLECEVITETDIGLGLYLNSLPLNYSPETDISAARFVRILRSDAIKFLPIFDSFNGLRNPLQIYESREKSLVPFNLLENETANHTVVIADSGSGKSAFIIDCVQAMKRLNPEPLIFAIEKKASHKIIGKYFDADMTIFEPNADIPFSPFRGIYDEAKISFLVQLLKRGIKLTSPSFNLESEHTSAITKALKLAYRNAKSHHGLKFENDELVVSKECGDVEITIDGFIAELSGLTSLAEFEKLESQIEEVLNKLRPFYGDGQYAKYFRTSSNIRSQRDTRYFIYDLDALDSDPILQELMTMSVIEEIRQVIKLPENKGRGGFVIIEELGMLGRTNDAASSFIIDAAETFRKLGVFLIGLTPRPQNYFEIDAGKAMWQVADNYVFLKMNSDNVEYLKEKSSLLDEANSEIIKSLQTIKDQYAEVFYMNKNKTSQGAFRYFQTKYDKWLSPTNLSDMKKVDDAFSKFKDDKWKALDYLAENDNV